MKYKYLDYSQFRQDLYTVLLRLFHFSFCLIKQLIVFILTLYIIKQRLINLSHNLNIFLPILLNMAAITKGVVEKCHRDINTSSVTW